MEMDGPSNKRGDQPSEHAYAPQVGIVGPDGLGRLHRRRPPTAAATEAIQRGKTRLHALQQLRQELALALHGCSVRVLAERLTGVVGDDGPMPPRGLAVCRVESGPKKGDHAGATLDAALS